MSGRIVAGIVAALVCLTAGSQAPHESATPSRVDLFGAWRLVRIEVQGRVGAEPDPFYGRGSEGLLIYDPAGWFSVQIEGRPRPAVDVPAHRPDDARGAAAEAKAAALDTYYAYYGTWTFDPAASTVTHHAMGALYPGERDATYVQHVHVSGDRLVFTRSQGIKPNETVQTKVWERVRPQ